MLSSVSSYPHCERDYIPFPVTAVAPHLLHVNQCSSVWLSLPSFMSRTQNYYISSSRSYIIMFLWPCTGCSIRVAWLPLNCRNSRLFRCCNRWKSLCMESEMSHIWNSERMKELSRRSEAGDTFYWMDDLLVFDMEACAAIGKQTVCLKPYPLFRRRTNRLWLVLYVFPMCRSFVYVLRAGKSPCGPVSLSVLL